MARLKLRMYELRRDKRSLSAEKIQIARILCIYGTTWRMSPVLPFFFVLPLAELLRRSSYLRSQYA